MRPLSLSLIALCLAALARPAAAAPEDFRTFVLWHLPPGSQKVPAVILIEGNGGTRPGSRSGWADWFNARGVAVAQVRSAASRGRQDWSGTGCGLQYSRDARDVIDLARIDQPRIDQPRIDTMRFALMGPSRGGAEVLGSSIPDGHHGFDGRSSGTSALPARSFATSPTPKRRTGPAPSSGRPWRRPGTCRTSGAAAPDLVA